MSCGTIVGAVKCVPKVDSLFGRVGSGRRRRRSIENQKPGGREGEAAGERGAQHYHREEEGGRRSSESRSPHHLNFLCAVCLGHYSVLLCCTLGEREGLKVREKVLVRS